MIVGVLLAAGRATRFGSDKLSHRLPCGMSILQASANALQDGVDTIRAVVREAPTPLTAQLHALGIEAVVCPEADAGMGASLACGVGASRHADAWLVYLADMPFIRATTVSAVAARLRQGASIAAPNYRGSRGHPIGFRARFRDALLGCSGDTGARRILSANPTLIADIPVDDVGVIHDIDRLRDLNRVSNP